MNKWFFIVISTLFIFSCEDDPVEEPSIYFGTSHAEFNGQEWYADVRAKFALIDMDYFLLTFDKFENNTLVNVFNIRKVKMENSLVQELNSDLDTCSVLCTSFSTRYIDEVGDYYDILDSDQFEDWIIIDSLNDQSLEIWGRFQASFIRDDRIPKMDNYPDTLYFENGTFNGKILE